MDRRRQLQVALVVTGVAFLLAYPLMHLWPSGWAWEPHHYEYEQMIAGIYATLGVFLIWAARASTATSSATCRRCSSSPRCSGI